MLTLLKPRVASSSSTITLIQRRLRDTSKTTSEAREMPELGAGITFEAREPKLDASSCQCHAPLHGPDFSLYHPFPASDGRCACCATTALRKKRRM